MKKLLTIINPIMIAVFAVIVIASPQRGVQAQTVVDIIVNSENHNTLEAAVVAANLAGALSGDGPFTVFAPTDAAFAALPAGLVDALLQDPSGALTQILRHHVVTATALSTSLTDGQVIQTALGQTVTVAINGEGVFISGAKVTVADVIATNGVVHVIDAVLVPAEDIKIVSSMNFGNIITDGQGRTLYFLGNDAFGNSLCTGGCLNNWPAFYSGNPFLGAGLDAADFGTIDRGAGVMQTAYKGWPLYYSVRDLAPGQVNGNGVGARWFVAKPDYTVMLVDNQLVGNVGINYRSDYTPGDQFVKYFVDAYGRTLYTRANDRFNRNRFTNADFSNNGIWPIYEKTQAIVPSTLNAADFAVINVHGRSQLTYKGWPLYYFGQDNSRGQNKGVSVPRPGVWPVAVPAMNAASPFTVVDIAVGSPAHTTLVAAVSAAGLVGALQGEGPFTVFAPTDAAFAALPAGTVETLLQDPGGLVTQILLYHVVDAKALSTDLSNGQMIKTLQGQDIKVSINEDGVFINNAKVIVADLVADNGVVHVIDAVLIPGINNVNNFTEASSRVYVFPNPARNVLNLDLNLKMAGNVVVEIYNIVGKQVAGYNFGNRTEMVHERIDVSNLPLGIYMISVRSGNEVITRKINIVK